jgi:hypothetical protein
LENLEVTDATWEALPEPIEGLDWVIRVTFSGTGLVDRAMPLVAAVGDVAVEALSGSLLGKSAQGFLSAVPPVGAKLTIGYPDTGLVETGVEFPGLPTV